MAAENGDTIPDESSSVSSGLASFIIWFVNTALRFVVRRITEQERSISLTDRDVSIAKKLTAARFINSTLVLTLVNINYATRWFDRDGFVYEATVLIIMMAVTDPIIYLINP